jgi:hypothetical protein
MEVVLGMDNLKYYFGDWVQVAAHFFVVDVWH